MTSKEIENRLLQRLYLAYADMQKALEDALDKESDPLIAINYLVGAETAKKEKEKILARMEQLTNENEEP